MCYLFLFLLYLVLGINLEQFMERIYGGVGEGGQVGFLNVVYNNFLGIMANTVNIVAWNVRGLSDVFKIRCIFRDTSVLTCYFMSIRDPFDQGQAASTQ